MRLIALVVFAVVLAGSPAWAVPIAQADPCGSPAAPSCPPEASPSPAPSPTPAPSPSPAPSPTEEPKVEGGILRSAVEAALGAFWGQLRAWAVETMADKVRAAMASAAQLLRTPELTGDHRLRELTGISWVLADALLLVLVAIGLLMRPTGTLLSKELLLRIPAAALAVNLVPLVAGKGISVSNALVKGLLAAEPDFLLVGTERALLSISASFALTWALWALGALLIALGILRIGVVVILLVAAPLAQLGWVLPATEGGARTWWRLLTAALATPVAQALVIAAGSWVWGTGGLATGGVSGTLIDLLMMAALTFMLVAVPWIGYRAALAPLLSGAGRLIRSARTGARLAGVTP